jgi:hypothetical protein
MSAATHPTKFEKLVALWTNDLPEAEAAAVEEHLFGCDECALASERLGQLVAGIREVVPPVLSHALRDKLAREGNRLRMTRCAAGGTARARFAPDVDLLVHVLLADVSRAERVDLEVVLPDGTTALAFEAVPFDPQSGEVLVACQRHYEGMFPGDPIFRVYAVEGGSRRLAGDYLIYHEWE